MAFKRRDILKLGIATPAAFFLQATLPAWARSLTASDYRGIKALSGNEFHLSINQYNSLIDNKSGKTILVNQQLPGPLLRWREGEDVIIHAHNELSEDTSIHWHGMLLPYQMDGVPGLSYPGIRPRETFTYQFPIKQAGTYWYHSHSGFQEQSGLYGPIIIEAKNERIKFDREYIVLLSDWTFENPQRVFAKLKKMSDSYNFQQRTLFDFFTDIKNEGFDKTISQRMMWGDMRMNPTDLADVTGASYTYLINGHSPSENWTGLFNNGERIRLRFINASAMSIFHVRIPGLPMTIVQSDGVDVQAIETDEFEIGTAETYDVIIKPEDKAYTVMCESNDRSGYARGTLTPRIGLEASVPAMRKRSLLTMKDMAMKHDMQGMNMEQHKHMNMQHEQEHNHAQGPGVVGMAMQPTNRLSERPNGLKDAPHRVLVYTDLKSLDKNPDTRKHEREIELHLTSNMERYMWSFDGIKFSEVDGPIIFHKDERLRLNMVNDTMMPHPIHLHGMYFDVVTNNDGYKPRKHTIVVKPGEKLSVDITADAVGDWAFHCHLLYHMMAGMMRVVSVKES